MSNKVIYIQKSFRHKKEKMYELNLTASFMIKKMTTVKMFKFVPFVTRIIIIIHTCHLEKNSHIPMSFLRK